MVTVTVFDGGDPATGEQRTLTVGGEPAELPQMVAERIHDLVAWLLKDEMPAPPAAVDLSDVPMDLWEDLDRVA